MRTVSFFLAVLLALVATFVAFPAHSAPFGIIKCVPGTPVPSNYIKTVNDGAPVNVAPHVGADGAVYFVVDAATLPQAAGVKLTVQAENSFGKSGIAVVVTDVGAPATPGNVLNWVPALP